MTLTYASLCSGVEAASLAWEPLGWKPAWFSEIDKFPSAVLAERWPQVPNRGDMTKFKEWPNDSTIDVLVGGTPCQSFSVAGLRKGLDDPRGNLMLTFGAIAAKYRPTWLVWENVPGVLSSNGGKDFGTFLGMLGELGYGYAYRVLDAQYFGVAQRRRRVFVIGHLGNWRPAAAVLFERHSLSGDPAPSREAGKETSVDAGSGSSGSSHWDGEYPHPTLNQSHNTGGIGASNQEVFSQRGSGLVPTVSPTLRAGGNTTGGHRPPGTDVDTCESLIPVEGCWRDGGQISQTLDAVLHKGQTMPEKNRFPAVLQPVCTTDNITHTLKAEGFDGSEDGTGRGVPVAAIQNATRGKSQNGLGISNPDDPMYTLDQGSQHAIAFPANLSGTQCASSEEVAPSMGAKNPTAHVELQGTIQRGGQGGRHEGVMQPNMRVRRLTPRECERLQGMPDGHTLVTYRGKPAADGPRYKAIGNSMAVPVMAWIGRRIQQVSELIQEAAA